MAAEQSRIDAAFDAHKAKLDAHFRERYRRAPAAIARDLFDENNIEQQLTGFATDLVNQDAVDEAAAAGIDAVPDLEGVRKPTSASVTEIWIGKVRKYAREFPGRMATDISQAAYDAEREANAAELSDDERIAKVLAAVDDAAETFRADARTYAEPAWGAGNQGYGQALESSGVLVDWVTEPGACDECTAIPEGNPYTLAALPMWPGDPHPNCRCHVTPDEESWQNIFGDAAA